MGHGVWRMGLGGRKTDEVYKLKGLCCLVAGVVELGLSLGRI